MEFNGSMMIPCSVGKYFLLTTLISFTSAHIHRLKCSTYANFVVKSQAAKLQSTFLTIRGIDATECKNECVLDARCKTININEDDLICELNNKSSMDAKDNITTVHAMGWTYYSTSYNETLIGRNCIPKKLCNDGFICYDTCDCPGYRCVEVRSCTDLYHGGVRRNGLYYINHKKNGSFPVFCDFESETNTVWTLLTSYTLRSWLKFSTPLIISSPVNENNPAWMSYRLGLPKMEYIRSSSTMWRVTCSFPDYKSDVYNDYVRAQISNVDITTLKEFGSCWEVDYINIRGHSSFNITVTFYQTDKIAFHTDSRSTPCEFDPKRGDNSIAEYFGFYTKVNKAFRCTESDESTTQYWYGVSV